MKAITKSLLLTAAAIVSLGFTAVRAQDAPPPPDQMQPGDQGAPPPDQMQDQGAPPPDQGAPPPDQGAPSPDQADQGGGDQGESFQDFYNQLGDQGTWVQTDNYGYAFQPNVTDPNWAPYSDGHWVYTDVGWTWASDEPWGWATYHYGRWVNIDGTGWVWVPGYRWAPAWVSWRYGGGYCGWAPLPPETMYGAEYGAPGVAFGADFHFGGDVDVAFGIGAGCYNFIPVGAIGYDNYRGRFLDRSRNFVVINNTTNVTNININNSGGGNFAGGRGNFRGVTLGGPPLAEVNAHSAVHVRTVQLTAASGPGASRLNGNSLAVYAPHVNAATIKQARPAQVSATIAHPTVNRGASITRPLQVSSHVAAVAPTEQAIQAAQAAQAHAPAKAHVATANTPVKNTFTHPLTSLTPVTEAHRTTAPANAAVQHTTSPVNNETHAASPYTGEANAPKPETHTEATPPVYHPQTTTPATVYHPQSTAPATPVYHPQTEEKPATETHTQTPVYHPQTESAPTYHPQTEEKQVESHPQAAAPSYHPQAEESHAAPAPASHSAPAPAPASHPSGGGGGGGGKPAPAGGDNKNQH